MACIYALVADFDPSEFRYVGRTKYDDPSKRLRQHLCRSSSNNDYKNNWIRQTLRKGRVVALVIEANLSWEESGEREIYWIDQFKSVGHRLTNLTIGGDGALGIKRSEETKEKIRRASLGRVILPATREKLRLAALQQERSPTGKQSPERAQKSRTAALGYRHTEETKAKISEANRTRVRTEESKNRTRLALQRFYSSPA